MNTLVAIHVAGAVALAGANVAALATTVAARRATTPREVLRLLRAHNLFAEKTVVPSAIVVLATGAWLTATTGAPLGSPWMAGTLVAFVVSALIGVLFLLPAERSAVAEARRLVDAGVPTVSDTLRRHTGSRAVVAAEWGEQVLLVVMFALMLVKPA